MANLTMHPGSLLLWCQFSEGYKLTMDYTGNFSPMSPLDDLSGALCPPTKTCCNCGRVRGLGMDDSTTDVLQVRRRGKWYKLGSKWWCVNCYAEHVPGRKPAWIYREEEIAVASWRNKGSAKHTMRLQALQAQSRKVSKAAGTWDSPTTRDIRKHPGSASKNTGEFNAAIKKSGNKDPMLAYYPAFTPGTAVRVQSGVHAGREGIVVRASSGAARDFCTDENQKYVVAVAEQRSEVEAKSLVFQSGPPIPPVRWGAKFGKRSMIFLSKKGVPLPPHGWTISVWFRTGKWIHPLSSPGHTRTLCETSTGDKIIALDHNMRLCSLVAPDADGDNDWTVHSTGFRLDKIKSQSIRNALDLDAPDTLAKEQRWVHLVVTATAVRETSSKSKQATMTYYLNGVQVALVAGHYPGGNVQVLGNAAVGHQNWDALSDFRIYSSSLPSDPSNWPRNVLHPPPTDAKRLMKWREHTRNKLSLSPSFVRRQIVAAGSLGCLSLVLRLADFVSIRRAAMCAVANIACVPSLRNHIIEIDGFVDILLTMISTDSGNRSDDNDEHMNWVNKEQLELLKYSRVAASALR